MTEEGELEVLMEVMLNRVVRRFKGDTWKETMQEVPVVMDVLKASTKDRFDGLAARHEAGGPLCHA